MAGQESYESFYASEPADVLSLASPTLQPSPAPEASVSEASRIPLDPESLKRQCTVEKEKGKCTRKKCRFLHKPYSEPFSINYFNNNRGVVQGADRTNTGPPEALGNESGLLYPNMHRRQCTVEKERGVCNRRMCRFLHKPYSEPLSIAYFHNNNNDHGVVQGADRTSTVPPEALGDE